jgi:hypothetical protein
MIEYAIDIATKFTFVEICMMRIERRHSIKLLIDYKSIDTPSKCVYWQVADWYIG